jgi:hypothetical protein
MTNSYSLSPRPKIVFIHGLNNNQVAFDPLIQHFKQLGYETELIILPGHGEDRLEAKTFKEALLCFDQSMKKLIDVPYYAIAFSHGALYLQLWLEKNQKHRPLKQVLLAPALFIRRQKLIEGLIKILPDFFVIKSLSPRAFRRFEIMNAWEYNILIQGMLTYQKIKSVFKIPTLILIDPKDELVDATRLKEELGDVIFFERHYLKKGIGRHHIMFHPDYFHDEDWDRFTRKMEFFFKNSF